MASLKSEGSATTVAKVDGKVMGKPTRTAITVLFARPDKILVGNDDGHLVTDGKAVYNYSPAINRYVKGKMSSALIKGLITARPGVNLFGLLYGVNYQQIISTSKLLADTKLGARDVYVLSIRLKSGVGSPKGTDVAQTLWIGKQDLGLYKTLTSIIMRPQAPKGAKGAPKLVERTIVATITSFQPNAKLPASAFSFKPPAGAKLYEQPKPVDLGGKPAPDFSFQWIDGQTKNLSDFRGKVVVLDFLALPMCEPALPVLQSASDKLKDRAQLIVVDINKDKAATQAYLKKKGSTFPVVFLDATSAKAIAGYHIMRLPTTVFIDEKGVIRAQGMGFPTMKDIEAKLSTMGPH
jgi:outer membrane lipoprotein-sorting protein/peroxiredoxin